MSLKYIQVWCEYDFGGQFGGNNNEEVYSVAADATSDEIEQMVISSLLKDTGIDDADELDELYGWSEAVVANLS
ncbi:hypothetical protein NVP1081O_314 [Vibrio phage 1.081.O._10N.286.52.C2]|nr:hypothetical protein NVP1081O_314 [Vibrio phage 1.081.O._10N.286.52.C2]